MHVCMLSRFSCVWLWDTVDCSLPGSSVQGILQARILEWVAMPSSQGIFPTQGSNPGLLHCRWILYHLSHQENPSTILQYKIKVKKIKCQFLGLNIVNQVWDLGICILTSSLSNSNAYWSLRTADVKNNCMGFRARRTWGQISALPISSFTFSFKVSLLIPCLHICVPISLA